MQQQSSQWESPGSLCPKTSRQVTWNIHLFPPFVEVLGMRSDQKSQSNVLKKLSEIMRNKKGHIFSVQATSSSIMTSRQIGLSLQQFLQWYNLHKKSYSDHLQRRLIEHKFWVFRSKKKILAFSDIINLFHYTCTHFCFKLKVVVVRRNQHILNSC